MRCGLRVTDALRLRADCVNHKMHRDALVPIDTELVDAIGQQRQRTHDRWCRVRLTVIDYGRVWVFWRSRS